MKIFIGADHAGFKLKQALKRWLEDEGHECVDVGNAELDMNDDYPEYGYRVASSVALDLDGRGIIVCGSAAGVCIVANKVKGIRAVAAQSVREAKLTREHNDANVLCLAGGGIVKGGRGLGLSLVLAKKITAAWLNEPFSRAGRHHRRVNQIRAIERKNLL
jgi:RpiB/LacA/LacB family sugar-phosphate isomerase